MYDCNDALTVDIVVEKRLTEVEVVTLTGLASILMCAIRYVLAKFVNK